MPLNAPLIDVPRPVITDAGDRGSASEQRILDEVLTVFSRTGRNRFTVLFLSFTKQPNLSRRSRPSPPAVSLVWIRGAEVGDRSDAGERDQACEQQHGSGPGPALHERSGLEQILHVRLSAAGCDSLRRPSPRALNATIDSSALSPLTASQSTQPVERTEWAGGRICW